MTAKSPVRWPTDAIRHRAPLFSVVRNRAANALAFSVLNSLVATAADMRLSSGFSRAALGLAPSQYDAVRSERTRHLLGLGARARAEVVDATFDLHIAKTGR